MRTSLGLFAVWSSRNLRGALKTKSPLWYLSTEFYYCFNPDDCRDKRRSSFKSYNGCNLISGQQNCHEQRTLIVPSSPPFLCGRVISFTSLRTSRINCPLQQWCLQSKHRGAGEMPHPLIPCCGHGCCEPMVFCPWDSIGASPPQHFMGSKVFDGHIFSWGSLGLQPEQFDFGHTFSNWPFFLCSQPYKFYLHFPKQGT